jgi:hypothetical protein
MRRAVAGWASSGTGGLLRPVRRSSRYQPQAPLSPLFLSLLSLFLSPVFHSPLSPTSPWGLYRGEDHAQAIACWASSGTGGVFRAVLRSSMYQPRPAWLPSKCTTTSWKLRSAGRCPMDSMVIPAMWHARYNCTSPSALTCNHR